VGAKKRKYSAEDLPREKRKRGKKKKGHERKIAA